VIISTSVSKRFVLHTRISHYYAHSFRIIREFLVAGCILVFLSPFFFFFFFFFTFDVICILYFLSNSTLLMCSLLHRNGGLSCLCFFNVSSFI